MHSNVTSKILAHPVYYGATLRQGSIHCVTVSQVCCSHASTRTGLTTWPPNSPDLNPTDYQGWGVLQPRVYQNRINNVEQCWKTVSLKSGVVSHRTSLTKPPRNGVFDWGRVLVKMVAILSTDCSLGLTLLWVTCVLRVTSILKTSL